MTKTIQTEYFTEADKMNRWLKENDVEVKDIKMTGTNTTVHFLVVYEKDFSVTE